MRVHPSATTTARTPWRFFRAWIRSNDEEEEFLDALFAQWDVDRELAEEIPDADLKDRLEDHESDISTLR